MGLFRRRDPRTDPTIAGFDDAMAELNERRRQLEEQRADEERRWLEMEAYYERRQLERQRTMDEFCREHGIERDDCYRCFGTGRVKVDCDQCNGRGYRNEYGGEQRRCMWCHGDGKEKKTCPDCGGSGRDD